MNIDLQSMLLCYDYVPLTKNQMTEIAAKTLVFCKIHPFNFSLAA